jgi:hypothetical protein
MSVTVRECPHCHTRVAFKDDGVCPACAKKLSDPGADSSKTVFIVSEASEAPPICIQCGENTDQKVTVERNTGSRGFGILRLIWTVGLYFLALLFHRLWHALDKEEASQKHPRLRVRVSVPYCGNCQHKNGLPEPLRVNFEMGRMSFLVEKTVADRLTLNVEVGDPATGSQRAKADK